jgi:hypothetical protein
MTKRPALNSMSLREGKTEDQKIRACLFATTR